MDFLKKFLLWLFSIQRIYNYELKIQVRKSSIGPKIKARVKVCEKEPKNLPSWGAKRVMRARGKYVLRKFYKRWNNHHLLFAAYHEDRLAAFAWVRLIPFMEYGKVMHKVHIYDCWTFAEYRGKGLLPFLLLNIEQYSKIHWKNTSVMQAYIASNNIPSIRGFEKAGFILKQKQILVRFVGMSFIWPK